MITLSLEEFTAKRKKAQTDIESALRSFVKRSLETGSWDSLLREVRAQYAFTYQDEGGDHGKGGQADPKWIESLLQTLEKTKDAEDKYAVERITVWLATAILTEATIAASNDDPEDLFLEWVTMHDSHVRETHRPANGQQRPIGEKFDVGGEKMSGPGDPTVSIDLWINCRCTLRPVLASEALTASVSDKPWDGSAGRFTPEQWKASCILHVCDGMEKSCHKLPIKEPGGALSRAGVHAAAGRIGSAQGPPEKIAAAKSSLRGAYKTLGETPPESLTAGGSMTDTAPEQPMPVIRIPWHGVLAPEGVWSGDKRRFAKDSLTTRDLPMPLTWQRASDEGHKGNVVVAKIEKTNKVDGELRATGHFIANQEADELIGMLGEFGKFGVSVDADEVVFDLEEDGDDEGVTFSNARVSSACVVPIPAFSQAFVTLGEPPEEWDMGEVPVMDEPVQPAASDEELQRFGRGPGWVTDPVATKRIHDYWTVPGQAGYAKIGWGTEGDFERCRTEIGQEIAEKTPEKLRFINAQCAQWQHDAIGIWPGKGEKAAAETLDLTDTETAEGIHLVASAGIKAPAAWFQNPGLTEPTPITVTDEGRVFGHIATWDTCHIGLPACTTAPHSTTDYAYFLTGQVPLDDGTRANTGVLSLGGGHAGPRLGMQAAIAHYDSTSAAVADITVGEDEHGIWMAGRTRPGVSDDKISTLMASKVSGDWRGTGREDPDLIAVLAVNVAGFPIPRTRVAAAGDQTVSLVAAGVVEERPVGTTTVDHLDVPVLAEALATAIEEREQRRAAMAAIAARVRGEK